MFGRAQTSMSETQRRKWKQTRERGQMMFCLQRALLVGVGASLYRIYLGAVEQNHPLNAVLLSALGPTISACLVGFVEGAWEWSSNEKRYLRAENALNSMNGSNLNQPQSSLRGTLNGNPY